MQNETMQNETKDPAFVHEKGVTYFSKKTERRIFFVMTIAMLLWGIADYAGSHL